MPTTPRRCIQVPHTWAISWVLQKLQSLSLVPFSPSCYSLLFHFSPHPHLPALVSCQPSASCPITRHVLVTIHVVPYPFSFPWLSIRRASWGLGWEEDSWTGFLLPSSFWRASLDWQLADTQGMEAGHGVGAGGKPE